MYGRPRARVKVNRTLSDYFNIHNGTRQGCPLSPLFALTLETLLCRVRGNKEIVGVGVGTEEHKVSAYADDLLFYLLKPLEYLP